eukprot:1422599-Pyramimonas_sp.AAC.1
MRMPSLLLCSGKHPIWVRSWDFYISVGIPPLAGLISSTLIAYTCGLAKPECLAVAVEVCYQNTAIGLAVALGQYTGDEQSAAAAVPVFYMLVQVALHMTVKTL